MSRMKSVFIWTFIFLTTTFFSISIERIYEVETSELKGHIIAENNQLSVYKNVFSVNEWWVHQPVVSLRYEGENKFRKLVESTLQQLGFLFGDGDLLKIRLEEVQKGVLFIDTSYKGINHDNHDALMTIGVDNEKKIFDFFQKTFGQHSKELPKLIVVKSEKKFTTDAQILYTGPQYSVLKSFDDELNLSSPEKDYNLKIPFYPTCYLDLTEEYFLLRIDSSEKVAFSVDGRGYFAPLELKLNKGVHRLECFGSVRHVYLLKDMKIDLNEMTQKSQLSLSVAVSADIDIYKNEELFFSSREKQTDLEIIPGDYTISVSKDGYQKYLEHITINSGENIIRNINLIPNPGTLLYSMCLEKSYADVFVNEQRALLTGDDETILINLKSGETKVEKVHSYWFNGEIILSDNKIFDTNFELLCSYDETLKFAVKMPNGLWIFTANKNIISTNPKNFDILWKRTVDYLAYDIVKKDRLLCILDAYSRVILIDSELGYREFFDVRIPGVEAIESIEETEEKIRVNLTGVDSYIDYYRRSRMLDIGKDKTEISKKELKFIDNTLYQDGNLLMEVSGNLIKIVKSGNLIAVLTDKFLKICVGY